MLRYLAVLPLLTLGLPACSQGDSDHAGHNHADDHDHDHEGDHDHDHDGHVHTAPHGGTLLVLAEESAHLELVLDRETGELNAYSLGAHADTPVRLSQTEIEVRIDGDQAAGREGFALELLPVTSTLTGDTAGNASRFKNADARLITGAQLRGTIARLESLGTEFSEVEFTLPATQE